jgi:hypothetical protein
MLKLRGALAVAFAVAFTQSSIARAQTEPLPPLPPGPEPAPAPAAAPAPAPVPAPVPASTPAPASLWYGDQTLYVDLASVLFVMTGGAVSAGNGGSSNGGATFLVATGAVGYFLGGPIVHMVHGRFGVAAGDLGIRIGMPLVTGIVGGLLGAAAAGPNSCGTDDFGSLCGALVGGAIGEILGFGGAVALDAAVLAREPKPDAATASPQASPPAVSFAPTFFILRSKELGQGSMPVAGVTGRF